MTWFDISGILTIIVLAGSLFAARRLGSRFAYPIRPLAAFNTLQQAIEDVVEGGTGFHYGMGRGALTHTEAAASLQGLVFQQGLIRQVSTSDDPLTVSSGDATLAWMAAETSVSAYRSQAAEEYYPARTAYFIGGTPLVTAAGALPQLLDCHTGSAVIGGHWGSETGLFMGLGNLPEKVSLAGSDDLSAQAVFFAGSPAALLGDEWFASDVYLCEMHTMGDHHRDASNLAGLITMDIVRWVFSAVILVAILARLAGSI